MDYYESKNPQYLIHYGVLDMKWGRRKDNSYRSHGIRAAVAKRQNKKIDKSLKNGK